MRCMLEETMQKKLSHVAIILCVLLLLLVPINAGIALIGGFFLSIMLQNPAPQSIKKLLPMFLGAAIVGLGATMDLMSVARIGLQGFFYTLIGIMFTLLIAFLLARLANIDKEVALLLGVGTAICGGSAIAAVSSAVKAKPEHVSIAMATVFLLNTLALFIFPTLGLWASLTETQFGLWSALAVHDTSSVVAVSMVYGPDALHVGTCVKLVRALWIAPVTMAIAYFWRRDSSMTINKAFPWFIIGFIICTTVFTFFPSLQALAEMISAVSKKLLVIALFLVGLSISPTTLKTVGARALLHGFSLWIITASISLILIYFDVMR